MAAAEGYPIPAEAARAEIMVINSRFIGSATYTPTIDAAKDFINQVRAEFPDATHHAYAYLVGYGASVIAGMSDAGEPPGTAGRPMLAVVRGSGLGDVTAVVTRYFGGTLLGTGGLVRAYGDAVKAVVEVLPRTLRIERGSLLIRVGYADYALARKTLETHQANIDTEDFAADVMLIATLPVSQIGACIAALSDATAGRAEAVSEKTP